MINTVWTPQSEESSAEIEVVAAIADTYKIAQAIDELDFDKYAQMRRIGGQLTSDNIAEYCDIAREYMESGYIVPIIITSARYKDKLHKELLSEHHKHAVVSSRTSSLPEMDYTTYVGSQGHFGGSSHQNADKSVRLSEVRYQHSLADVALRHVDTAIIDLSAIRLSDNPGHPDSWPTGMTIEEICQIAQYIGASTQLKAVIIENYHAEKDVHCAVAKNIALILWYICSGYTMRQAEKHHSEVNTYTIYTENLDVELVFTENKHSGRWWLQIPSTLTEEEYITVPCTADDYRAVCEDDIPDKIARMCIL